MTEAEDAGTRAIRMEVEVPGTPEQVWEAIATGHGISAWFVPTEVEGLLGGRVVQHFGEGLDAEGTVTAFEPPRRFAYRAGDEAAGGLAFEFLVEARDKGTCVVRLVNSGFGEGEDWDEQYTGMEEGWALFLHNLVLYRTHFPGRRCASILVNGTAEAAREHAWESLLRELGLTDPVTGTRMETHPDAPRLAGTVDRVTPGMLTLILDEPAAGVAFVAAEGSGNQVSTSAYLYLYGEVAAAVADRERPAWQAWMQTRFPTAELPAAD